MSQGPMSKLDINQGVNMHYGPKATRESPEEGSRQADMQCRARETHTHGGQGHLPVTVSPFMAGGAENVHLNDGVLQGPEEGLLA